MILILPHCQVLETFPLRTKYGCIIVTRCQEEQGLPREWGLTGKWEDGPTYEQIQAIDAKYKPALDAWVDSLGLRQAKKYLESIDMKLTGAGRAKKKSLTAGRKLQQSLAVF
jgi:hypothetical protein